MPHPQGKLLSWVDPELAAHLERLEVCPPMFMLRWLRLAFVREFSVVRVARVLGPQAWPTSLNSLTL